MTSAANEFPHLMEWPMCFSEDVYSTHAGCMLHFSGTAMPVDASHPARGCLRSEMNDKRRRGCSQPFFLIAVDTGHWSFCLWLIRLIMCSPLQEPLISVLLIKSTVLTKHLVRNNPPSFLFSVHKRLRCKMYTVQCFEYYIYIYIARYIYIGISI